MSVRLRAALTAALVFASAGALAQSAGDPAERELITRVAERLEPARKAASEACGTPLAIAFDPQSLTPGGLTPGSSPFARLTACRAAFSAVAARCAAPEGRAAVAQNVSALLCVSSSTRLISLSEGILRFEEKPGAPDPEGFVETFLLDAL
jgi:hypothetical protein